MTLKILVALGWLGFWALVFADRWFGEASLEILVALLVGTTFGAGLVLGSWWALLLPPLILPVFGLRSGYTPGAEPDYSIGLLVGAAFVLIATPCIASGVALARR